MVFSETVMNIELLQSHFTVAQSLFKEGELAAACREAELAVDEFWKDGDSDITQALPLLSMLRHARQSEGNVFDTLDDLPTSHSHALLSEATQLHEQYQTDASLKMMSDVNSFISRWVGEEDQTWHEALHPDPVGETKVEELRSQVAQFYSQGSRNLAVETSLELAKEYALRGKHRRAFDLFRQVVKKSNRTDRVAIRINGLLDFGQFMSRLGKPADAERLFRLAAGVSRKAKDREKYAHVMAALGVVLMHQEKNDLAKRYLKKAGSMLEDWDVEADIVSNHLEALREGAPCDCPEASISVPFIVADWD